MKIKAKYVHYALLFFCLLIFTESSIPGDKLPKADFEFSDKFIHAAIYFILYILFFYSLKYQTKSVKLHRFSFEFALLFTVLYGASDEIHQYFVPNRSCEFYDWVADIAGAVIGLITVKYFLLKKVNIAVLFLLIFVSGCNSSDKKDKADSTNIKEMNITEADSWINKMPGVGNTNYKFGFLISINIESDDKPEDFEVRNLVIFLNNDTLKSAPFETDIFESSKGTININVRHDLSKDYLDPEKPEPTDSKFEFDIYSKNKKSGKINTDKFKILTVY